jgi:hypothetical protein
MICAGHKEQFRGHSCRGQALRIFDIFFDEEVERSNPDECRRESFQFRDSRRHCPERNVGRTGRLA